MGIIAEQSFRVTIDWENECFSSTAPGSHKVDEAVIEEFDNVIEEHQ